MVPVLPSLEWKPWCEVTKQGDELVQGRTGLTMALSGRPHSRKRISAVLVFVSSLEWMPWCQVTKRGDELVQRPPWWAQGCSSPR